MKLKQLFESQSSIEFVSPHDEELDVYPLLDQAEKLVKDRGLHMLRNDEISDMAVVGDRVVGVLYNGNYGDNFTSSIVVHPDYEGRGLAKELFSLIPFDYFPQAESHVCELLPPFTMESFLKKNGYEFEGAAEDMRIYKKELDNSVYF